MQWMDIWMYPYCIPTKEVGWLANSGLQIGTKHTTTTWLSPGSTSDWIMLLFYIYIKCLKPLPMQWMDICMYPYCIKTREVGWLASSGQIMGTNHTITTWLRPGTTSDWIKFSFYIYSKCLSLCGHGKNALVVLYQEMRSKLHRRIRMVIEIAGKPSVLFFIVN